MSGIALSKAGWAILLTAFSSLLVACWGGKWVARCWEKSLRSPLWGDLIPSVPVESWWESNKGDRNTLWVLWCQPVWVPSETAIGQASQLVGWDCKWVFFVTIDLSFQGFARDTEKLRDSIPSCSWLRGWPSPSGALPFYYKGDDPHVWMCLVKNWCESGFT